MYWALGSFERKSQIYSFFQNILHKIITQPRHCIQGGPLYCLGGLHFVIETASFQFPIKRYMNN